MFHPVLDAAASSPGAAFSLFASFPWIADGGLFQGGIWSILSHASIFAKGILLVLFIFTWVSWAIIIDRWRTFRRHDLHARGFVHAFRRLQGAAEVYALASRERHTPLARICLAGHRELSMRLRHVGGENAATGGEEGSGAAGAATATVLATSHDLRPDDFSAVQRALEQGAVLEVAGMEARLSFLATCGSVSPFIGLLGTVWGVMTSFLEMGQRGAANLAVVAPGIAEALIATAAGLFAAIPAVMAYNYFIGRARQASMLMDTFILEFMNLVEREYRP